MLERGWSKMPGVLFLACMIVFATKLIAQKLFLSLWIDELVSYWVIKDGFGLTWSRSMEFQGQSPLYFLMLCLWSKLSGTSEFALRGLSLIFCVGSFWLIYKFASRFGGALVGGVAVLLCLSFEQVIAAGISVRPYAAAVFFALLSIGYLISWCEYGRFNRLIAALVCYLCAFYCHYLFAPLIILYPLFWWACVSDKRQSKFSSLVIGLFCAVVCFLPAYGHLSSLAARSSALSFAPRPTLGGLLQAILPLQVAVLLFASGACALVMGQRQRSSILGSKIALGLVVAYLFPPVLFYISSSVGSVSLFLPRYFAYYAPAGAVFFATLLASYFSRRGMATVFGAICLLSVISAIETTWVIEDWKAALNKTIETRSLSDPVFLNSGLVEINRIEDYQSAETRNYLLSPISLYPVNFEPQPIPFSFETSENRLYFENEVLPKLNTTGRGFFVFLQTGFYEDGRKVGDLESYYRGHLKAKNFGSRVVGTFGRVLVIEAIKNL